MSFEMEVIFFRSIDAIQLIDARKAIDIISFLATLHFILALSVCFSLRFRPG